MPSSGATSTEIAAVVYAPACEDQRGLAACASRLSELLLAECGAAASGFSIAEGS